MVTWTSPLAVAFRDTATELTGKFALGAALRGLGRVYDWRPPDR
jgi:hypothetical protein